MSGESEEVILEALKIATGFLVESSEIDIHGAIGFAQISSHTQGFEQGVLLTWPSAIQLAVPPSEMAKAISIRLNASVLLELDDNSHGWLLAAPDGSTTATNVVDLDDGIDTAPL